MHACYVVEITTPKRYLLNGLWFGPKRAKRCVVWVHGLGSSMFSKLKIAETLVDGKTAVLVFNNRGHDKVAYLPHESRSFKRALRAGAAHERFTDSVDDIQGAVNFARRNDAKEIYIAGHSTGCQKSMYWAHKKGRGVKGIILLGPMSDYSGIHLEYDEKTVARALTYAHKQVQHGKGNELLPPDVWGWPWIADAQRFVSLYSGRGPEEIFTYWNQKKSPRMLKTVRLPVLVVLAAREEFTHTPAKKLASWFATHVQKGKVVIIPRVKHSFRGGEKLVAREIRRFIGR
ncbi:alpha/beta fold hydrolase [Candidatus Kaiserbacteria bacterium]|nr:alpha/beta fold hydrolase [Candidatus Kaiserbacteria bacterium]